MMNVYEKLQNVQAKLKAPKNQYNSFGKYNYRSCEDILEGLKPLLGEFMATLTLKDEIVQIGERFYIKAIASFIDIEKGDKVETTALAREDENKKGMDLAQVTGSVSSYARKYALNGLFCIDDTKDSDAINEHGKGSSKEKTKGSNKKLTQAQVKRLFAIANKAGYGADVVKKQVLKKYNVTEIGDLNKQQYDDLCNGYEKLQGGNK
jgi:hypothetical protein